MDEKNRKNKIKTLISIVILVVVVAIAIITACILHAKENELAGWNDQMNNLPQAETVELFENFS